MACIHADSLVGNTHTSTYVSVGNTIRTSTNESIVYYGEYSLI